MRTKSCAISTIIIALVLAAHPYADAHTADIIIGKVVAIADGDTITVSARYRHHSVAVNIKGNSYRLKAKEVEDVANDCQKLKARDPLFMTENGTLSNDR